MRLPRDLSGDDLAKALKVLGYRVTHQTGSHMPLTTAEHSEHHITIPKSDPLRVGTLSGILTIIADHFEMSREELARKLL
jgi:predicted RNA binding protein YcfA (HicA-like mRNA interferase family)